MKGVTMNALLCLILISFGFSQHSPFGDKLANTYSIVARDPETGNFGVAVQSNWFAVGTLVTWAEAGVGAIATQSFINVSYGPEGLKLLKAGKSAQEVVEILTSADENREFRQLAVVDKNGNSASFTGKKCIEAAGDHHEAGFSVQANLMKNASVWPAMEKAYKQAKGAFADRLIQALEAAQAAGGDIRGKQSAAILIVKAKSTGKIWEDVELRITVDDHPEPLKELRRIYNVKLAYDHMNKGDLHVEENDMDNALKEYGAAQKMFPDNLEMQYWTAIALANSGRLAEALPIFKTIFKKDENWRILTPRLTKNAMLTVSDTDLKTILSQ
ncbi:MAG: DUF1028 domain-containing protein [Calditrichaeota bacterium]|nr:DUF1028 domain-containing protein [Calditrichota bacterium]